jgi:pyrroline-5-carboxylate reductase
VTIKLGLIGGGVMGEAILSRLITTNVYNSKNILVSEPQSQRRSYLQEKYQIQVTSNNQEVFTQSEVILLAIKPQIFETVVRDLTPEIQGQNKPLIISILAGTSLFLLEKAFPTLPVIRAMPNTPATVGAGITAIAGGKNAQDPHLAIAKTIFEAVGEVVTVGESLIDAVTGLSGSGPAFVALMVESLSDGGVAAGLPRQIASKLALQTVLGTAKLLQETNIHPAQLKDQVTSPGGTTIYGVSALEKAGFRSGVIEAVRSAYRRAVELGQLGK